MFRHGFCVEVRRQLSVVVSVHLRQSPASAALCPSAPPPHCWLAVPPPPPLSVWEGWNQRWFHCIQLIWGLNSDHQASPANDFTPCTISPARQNILIKSSQQKYNLELNKRSPYGCGFNIASCGAFLCSARLPHHQKRIKQFFLLHISLV